MLDTLYKVLHESASRYASNVAFSQYQGEDITYAEVEKRALHVAQMLCSAGLKPGDKVAIYSSNTANWGICYYAATAFGFVAVPILPDFSSSDVDQIIAHSEAKALFVSDRLYSRISKDTLSKFNIVIRTKNLTSIIQNVSDEGALSEPKADDLAVIIYTSGTTSQPKGVMLSHRNLTSQIELIGPIFRCVESDVLLSVLPLSHTYECTLTIIYAFSCGSHMVYLDKAPTISVLSSALRDIRPTIMLVVPLIIDKIYQSRVLKPFTSSGFRKRCYSCTLIRKVIHSVAGRRLLKFFGGRLRFFGIGGAKLDLETERFLLEAGVPYAIGYGLTETAPLLAAAIGKGVKLGSTGHILKGVDYRLDSIDPKTGLGEILVKSPSQMIGYYKNEDATSQAFTPDGFFRTGDLGCFDRKGNLYIRGRLKNMIVGPSGENIYPEDIETVLNSHSVISESVVTQKEGRLVALVHFDAEAVEKKYVEFKEALDSKYEEWSKFVSATLDEIKKYVNDRVSRGSRVDEVVEHKEEFVKTPTKKIRRFLYSKKN